jgi:tetratricopeptide (TPR) repeat protein
MVLRHLGLDAEAVLAETLAFDPLDGWSRHLAGHTDLGDAQSRLDLAHDLARAGFFEQAIKILEASPDAASDLPDQSWGAAPLVAYTRGWLQLQAGDQSAALSNFRRAATLSADYCFPARLEEIAILEAAMAASPGDARAPYYLGNLLYDRHRHGEAIALWEKSAKLAPEFSIVWRNLGIGYYNVRKQSSKARTAYDRAFRVNPDDARLLYERDQLWKRLALSPTKRLRELENHASLVALRDDLSIELCALYNQTRKHEKALGVLSARKFQPWEGGEGQALGQHVRTRLALGRQLLATGDAGGALSQFHQALEVPGDLGESRHLLANASDIWFWLGEACAAIGDNAAAKEWWGKAANFRGDFQEMSVRAFSEMTFFSILSMDRLGRKAPARKLASRLLSHAKQLAKTPAKIDYFATSLPTLLLFEEDLQARQQITARFLSAQAVFCLGQKTRAAKLAREVLVSEPSHAAAADFLAFIS